VFLRRRQMRKNKAPRIASAIGIPTPTPTFRPRFELEGLPPAGMIDAVSGFAVSLTSK
jgi:hypothetical protein